MIVRVEIEHLVIVERATFEPGRGMTAITGETGAGKTLLATAIGLLFGDDADASQVGPGASQAWVEGEFEPDASFWEHPDVETLAQLRPEPDAPLVLARRVDASGRSRALAWGRTVTKGDLAAAGKLLLATAGQHVQIRLRSAEHQRRVVDAAGGDTHALLLREMQVAYAALRDAERRREQVEQVARDGAERRDAMREDLARIDAVGPSLEEREQLLGERNRARRHADIVAALAHASAVMSGSELEAASAVDAVGAVYGALVEAARHDESVAVLADEVLAAQSVLTDVAAQVSTRLDQLADGPRSIDDIEARLGAYDELERRFGGTIESVLARQQQLRADLLVVEDATRSLERAQAAVDAAAAVAADVAARLTAARCALADTVAADVSELLAELGMAGSVFRIGVDEAPLSMHGADDVRLLLAPSVDVEPRPVARVASGGELSRVALALLMASTPERSGEHGSDDGVATILFDEIDAGIGGHTAHAVAMLLRRLADRRQVLCITHLPQVAARADAHVVIEKTTDSTGARTTLRTLRDEPAVADELVRMLGAGADDAGAREHVRELRGPRFLRGSSDAPAAVARPGAGSGTGTRVAEGS